MGKMKKMGKNFLNGEIVKNIIKEKKECLVTFLEEPHEEENTVEGRSWSSYHVSVQANDGEIYMWNMNGKTSDYLSEKFGGDTKDFVGKSAKLDVVKTATQKGMRDTVYPAEMLEEEG